MLINLISDCGWNFTGQIDSSGEIYPPGYPGHYDNDLSCTYFIITEPYLYTVLYLEAFRLPYNAGNNIAVRYEINNYLFFLPSLQTHYFALLLLFILCHDNCMLRTQLIHWWFKMWITEGACKDYLEVSSLEQDSESKKLCYSVFNVNIVVPGTTSIKFVSDDEDSTDAWKLQYSTIGWIVLAFTYSWVIKLINWFYFVRLQQAANRWLWQNNQSADWRFGSLPAELLVDDKCTCN